MKRIQRSPETAPYFDGARLLIAAVSVTLFSFAKGEEIYAPWRCMSHFLI